MEFKEKYGKWALVTGATSGIGEELSNQLAAKGLNIVLIARKEKELNEKASSLSKKFGIETRCVSADLASIEGVESVKTASKDLEVGLLVLAAGIEVNGAFEKNDIRKEIQVVQINVISTLALTHHFISPMIKRGKGGVLLIASLSGHMPNPYFANYAGTKSYVLNFGASLYGELKPKGIDVTVLSPGLTSTPMVADNGVDWSKTPMSPLKPEMVAAAGLNALGKKFLAIPGGKNKIMAVMAKHSPLQMQTSMNEKMMRKAIRPDKL
jgi:short-subunit dehydrogenase